MSDDIMLNEPAFERILYPLFRKNYLIFRMSDLSNRFLDFTDPQLELPVSSILHMVDNLHHDNPSIFPDMTHPFIVNSELILYMDHVINIAENKNNPIRHRFLGNTYRPQFLKFFKDHKEIKRMLNPDMALGRKLALPIYNYNPLLKILTYGRNKKFDKFTLILNTILENIKSQDKFYSNRLQFISIDMNTNIYNKIRYMKAFKEFTNTSLKPNDDYDFYFLCHVLGYIADSETNILKSLDDNLLDRLHICLHIKGKGILFNLKELKDLSKGNKLFYMRVLKQIHFLKAEASGLIDHESDEDTVDKVISENEVDEIPALDLEQQTTIVNPEDVDDIEEDDIDLPLENRINVEDNYTVNVRDRYKLQLERAINNTDITLSDKQKERALEQLKRFKRLELNNKPITELLNDTGSTDLDNGRVERLEDNLIDKSMSSSRISNFDETYIEEQLDKDLASVFTSFINVGMILNDISHKDEITEFNRIRYYKLRYQDITGKKHTVNFKIPLLNNEGEILISGITSKMIKQQINVPICKVSPTRVNLSSNFNKALVEKSKAQARRFDISLLKYLSHLISNNHIKAEYGKLNTPKKLAYDYTCIASRYTRLTFKDYDLTFDYNNRLNSVATEAYRELKDCFTHDDELYNLKALQKAAESIKTTELDINHLLWILQFDQIKSEKRMDAVNIDFPLLVTFWKGKYVVVDGLHRLTKYHYLNKTEVKVKIIPEELLKEHLMSYEDQVKILQTSNIEELELFLRSAYIGTKGNLPVFYGLDNIIRVIDKKQDDPIQLHLTIRELFSETFEDIPIPRLPIEWTELQLLDKAFPVGFVLAYQFGLSSLLQELNHPFRFVEDGKRTNAKVDDIVISFKNGKLVFPRYPLKTGLVLSGLDRFKLHDYDFEDMNHKDTYFNLLDENNVKTNYLKGMTNYFNYFIDPITRDVLMKMGEPISPKGLLLRATDMLSTAEHLPAASLRHHRLRGYERFPAIIYNNLARNLANLDAQRSVQKRSFSINPDQILYAIIQDQTFQQKEVLNPIHDIKMENMVTFAGHGGRQGRTMVASDRVFAEDAIGVLSESTPDSNKVGINNYTVVDPELKDMRGFYLKKDLDDLEPANILSVSSMLLPSAIQDDSKRISYISKELSHHVPSDKSEVSRVRTGYESVVAHRAGEEFAAIAKKDGQIIDIDETLNLIKVKYNKTNIDADKTLKISLPSTTITNAYTNNSSIGYAYQGKELKDIKVNDIVTLNDYNKLFKITEITSFKAGEELPDLDMRSSKKKELQDKEVIYVRFSPITYNEENDIDIFRYGEIFTTISGSSMKQTLLLNDIKKNDKVKEGDVLAYNQGFFEPDGDKQVNWKHGVMANVVFMDKSETYEDSCQISRDFAHRLSTTPAHIRMIELTANTVIHSYTDINTHVETTDHLMILEDADLDAITSTDDADTIDLLASLNRKLPRAKYHGKISKIEMYHSCDFNDLDPSLQKLARRLNKEKIKYYDAYQDTKKKLNVALPSKVPVGTKYQGVSFDDESMVVIIFTITENLGFSIGDKLTLLWQAKSTLGSIMEQGYITESGKNIDMVFGASAVSDRILNSFKIIGIAESTLEQLEGNIVDMYFNK